MQVNPVPRKHVIIVKLAAAAQLHSRLMLKQQPCVVSISSSRVALLHSRGERASGLHHCMTPLLLLLLVWHVVVPISSLC